MSKARRLVTLSFAAVLVAGMADVPSSETLARRANARMVEAARAFLQSLDRAQADRVMFSSGADDRFDWKFVPARRTGLPFRDMTAAQRTAGHTLLRSTLSAAGYAKVKGIIHLEQILGVLENRPQRRDPEDYHFWFFGEPSTTAPWAWRFEGHHLSISFAADGDELRVSTPAFMGANPAVVPSGPFTGARYLGGEEDLARALLASLTPAQRRRAVIAAEAPRDIITGADRVAHVETFEGIAASELNADQRRALTRLAREYLGNVETEAAHYQMTRFEQQGWENIYFAWAGSSDPGEGHYYRIHGPVILIEYDNTQNDANHVHSVWRDLEDDFGRDLLRDHYDADSHSH